MTLDNQNASGEVDVTEGAAPGEKDLFTTGDLARMTGNTVRTVRHYEEIGLLETMERTPGSRRLFTWGGLQKLKFITDLRELNIPLAQIREILDVGSQATDPSTAAKRLFTIIEQTLDELNNRITQLKRIRDNLACTKETFRECKTCHISWDNCHCKQCDSSQTHTTSPLFHVLWPISAEGCPHPATQTDNGVCLDSGSKDLPPGVNGPVSQDDQPGAID